MMPELVADIGDHFVDDQPPVVEFVSSFLCAKLTTKEMT
jgi:hypothetical protein